MSKTFPTPRRSRTAWWWRCARPASAAATGTAGWATTRRSRCRTCPGTSLPAWSPRPGPRCAASRPGDRVTVPFCCGCGRCEPCRARPHADLRRRLPARLHGLGLVRRAGRAPARRPEPRAAPGRARLRRGGEPRLPLHDRVRGRDRARPRRAGDWVAVHGCGGVGLSALMIASALGAAVVAVDVDDATLELARSLGAGAHRRRARRRPGRRRRRAHRRRRARLARRARQRRHLPRARSARCASAAATSRSA